MVTAGERWLVGRVTLVLLVLVAAWAGPAGAQQADAVVIDDPADVLGEDREVVAQAGRRLVDGSALRIRLVVAVVPSLDGRRARRVIARHSEAAAADNNVTQVLLLLATSERVAVFGVPDSADLDDEGVAVLLEALQPASAAATDRFESGGAGAAALAGISRLAREDGVGTPDPSELPAGAWLSYLIPVLFILGVLNLFRGMRARRRLKGFGDGVTAIRDLQPGPAMVVGAAVTAEPLLSPVTGTPCVHWEVAVTEDWTKATGDVVSWEDPNRGGVRREEVRNVRRTSGTKVHDPVHRRVPFDVDDGTGVVGVMPYRAEVEASVTFDATVDQGDPAYHAVALDEHRYTNGVRHLRESVVRAGEPVTVLGPVSVDGGRPLFQWTLRRSPGARRRFLITVDEPAWAQRGQRRQMIRRFAVAAACLAGIIVILALTATWNDPSAAAAALYGRARSTRRLDTVAAAVHSASRRSARYSWPGTKAHRYPLLSW